MFKHSSLAGKDKPFDGCVESQIGGRAENQDCVDFCDTDFGRLVIVCDGMGGGPGGATASTEAVAYIKEYVRSVSLEQSNKKTVLENAIQGANLHLRRLQSENRQLQGMGTTCICLLIDSYSAMVAQVGDSRLYLFRFGKKHWRTWDHSQVMARVKELYGKTSGKDVDEAVEMARVAPNSNVITRALGVNDTVSIEMHELAFESGDRFALCTDGIWGAMPEKELISLLTKKVIGGALDATMRKVQEIGVANGNHHDNYTLALLQPNYNSKLKEKMTRTARLLIFILSAICIASILLCTILAGKIHNGKETSVPVNPLKDSTIMVMQNEINGYQTNNEKLSEALTKANERIKELEKELKNSKKQDLSSSGDPDEKKSEEEMSQKLNRICEELDEIIREFGKGINLNNEKINDIRQKIIEELRDLEDTNQNLGQEQICKTCRNCITRLNSNTSGRSDNERKKIYIDVKNKLKELEK